MRCASGWCRWSSVAIHEGTRRDDFGSMFTETAMIRSRHPVILLLCHLVIALLLAACSPFAPPPAPTAVPTAPVPATITPITLEPATLTPSLTPTFAPTPTLTPTMTLTPTLTLTA